MITRLANVVLIMTLISGCASGIEYVGKVKPESFQGNAVLVGSIVSPDDGIIDMFVVRGLDDRETYRITDREQIREDNEHYQVGMFALVVPPGTYAYFSVNNRQPAEMGGTNMTWYRPKLLLNEEVNAGDFIYVGRAFCDATSSGCIWSVNDESARDLPVLKKLNPRLPWERIKVYQP